MPPVEKFEKHWFEIIFQKMFQCSVSKVAVCPQQCVQRYSVGMLPVCTEGRNVPEILAQPLFSKNVVQIHEKV